MNNQTLSSKQLNDEINYFSNQLFTKSDFSENFEKLNNQKKQGRILKHKKIHKISKMKKIYLGNFQKKIFKQFSKNKNSDICLKQKIMTKFFKEENFSNLKISNLSKNLIQTIPSSKILTNMIANQQKWKIHENPDLKTEINSKMRLVLVDWLLKVNKLFQMNPETYFLAIYYLEKFSQNNIIFKKDYQLIGIVCLYIASKYHEVKPPKIKQFVYICDGAINKNKLLEMEEKVLVFFNFDLFINSPFEMMCILNTILVNNEIVESFAANLLMKSLLHVKSFTFLPSVLALSAILLSLNFLNEQKIQNFDILKQELNMEKNEINSCMIFLFKMLDQKVSYF